MPTPLDPSRIPYLRTLKRTGKSRETNRNHNSNRRALRRRDGMCTTLGCDNKAGKKFATCIECRLKGAQAQRERRSERRGKK